MYRAHKIRIDCTKEQHSLMMQTAGCARYAYNWALEKWGKMDEARKADASQEKPSAFKLMNLWTIEKPEWANKTARSAVTCSLNNLGTAFNNFIRRKAKYPKKHKRSQGISFQIANDKAAIVGNRLRLPNIDYVKLRETPRFQGKITGYTVQLIASHWYVTVAFDCPDVPKEAPESVVGIDVGLQQPAVASDGTKLELPIEKLQKLEVKKRRAQRALSRSKRNSNARERKRAKLQRIQQKITNIRQDAAHKFTTTVCKKPRNCSHRRSEHKRAPFQGPRTFSAQSLQQLPHGNHSLADLVQSGAPYQGTKVLPEHKTVLNLWTHQGGHASSDQNIPLRRMRSPSRQR